MINAADSARLRQIHAEKIANVAGVIEYARDQQLDYELAITAEVRRLKAMAAGQVEGSDAQRDTLAWIIANELALEDARSK